MMSKVFSFSMLLLGVALAQCPIGKGVTYVARSATQCAAIRFKCEVGSVAFFCEKGCGCKPAEADTCECGAACTMSDSTVGICQVDGQCAQNIEAPICNPDVCPCGESCTMVGGGTGTCQTSGECAQNIVAPDCSGTPKVCPCGESCTMEGGGMGTCQEDGSTCAVNIMPPQCTSPDICTLPAETGPCKAAFPRWYFDSDKGKCERFTYGGCGGNDNNFGSKKECLDRCKQPDCPQFCTLQYNPVCGTDGKTYSNGCFLDIANCESGGEVTKASDGPCGFSDDSATIASAVAVPASATVLGAGLFLLYKRKKESQNTKDLKKIANDEPKVDESAEAEARVSINEKEESIL